MIAIISLPGISMASSKSLQQAIANIKIWHKGEQRAPHKPLLLLYVLAGYLNGTVGIFVGTENHLLNFIIFLHRVKCDVRVRPSHLRTIGTSIDINGRFFMTEIRATQGFSLFFAQPKSTYINLLMWIQLQLRLYPDSIMFVPTQNP